CGEPLQVGCFNYPVMINCPKPGDCPGFSPTAALIQRINFGLPDNNFDGKPDASPATLDMSKIHTKQFIHGDTLLTQFEGVVNGGPGAPVFTQAYLETTLGGAETSWMRGVKGLYATVEVYDENDDLIGTKDNLGVIHVSDTKRQIDFSINQLGFNDYDAFLPGHKIKISVYYRVEQPYNSSGGMSGDRTVNLNNKIYLSDVVSPTSESDKWYCGELGGYFFWAGLSEVRGAPDNSQNSGCNPATLTFTHYLRVGTGYAGNQRFPYEYRPIVWSKQFTFTVPDGYQFVQLNITESINNGYQASNRSKTNVTPIDPNASTLVFDLSDFYVENGGDWHYPDEAHQISYVVTLQPTCGTAPGVQTTLGYSYWQEETEMFNDVLPWGWQGQPPMVDSPMLIHNKPNLNLTSSQPEITVFGPGVQWDIQVSNTNSATANNDWLAKNTGSSGVTITKIERLNAAGGTPVEEITPVNGIYQLGNFTAQSRFYRITAEYINCERD